MRLENFLNEIAKTLIVKSREKFENHVERAAEDENASFDRYKDWSKVKITKTVKKKMKQASPIERKRAIERYTSDKEIKSKGITEIILHYGEPDPVNPTQVRFFNVIWRP